MATEDDKVDTGALGTVVAVGAVAMVGIALAVNALVRHEASSLGAARDEVGGDAYRTMKQEQLDKLSAGAAWADQGKGHVAIPIDRAMNLVLADLKRSPWNATPAPPPDAGADAATEAPDAGVDAATTAEVDAGGAGAPPDSGTGTAPEPPGSAPLSPGVPPAGSAPPAPQPLAPRTARAPTAPPPASAPAQPAPPAPSATKP